TQKQSNGKMECTLEPKYGQVQLNSFAVKAPVGKKLKTAQVQVGGQLIPAKVKQEGTKVLITWVNRITVKSGDKLILVLV
ncbi:hypothetical protein EZS27_033893, partial [termite gut metagenome]